MNVEILSRRSFEVDIMSKFSYFEGIFNLAENFNEV